MAPYSTNPRQQKHGPLPSDLGTPDPKLQCHNSITELRVVWFFFLKILRLVFRYQTLIKNSKFGIPYFLSQKKQDKESRGVSNNLKVSAKSLMFSI